MSQDNTINDERPDWLVEGAEVLAYSDNRTSDSHHLVKTTVKKIATRSFTLEADNEPRYSLPSCSYQAREGNHRYVVPLDSDRARVEIRRERELRQIARARDAVDTWVLTRTADNRLAAIAALQGIENDEVR
jgi:hypothetical protein